MNKPGTYLIFILLLAVWLPAAGFILWQAKDTDTMSTAASVIAGIQTALVWTGLCLGLYLALRYRHLQTMKRLEEEARTAEFQRKKEWEEHSLVYEKQRIGHRHELQAFEIEKMRVEHELALEKKRVEHELAIEKMRAEGELGLEKK